MKKLTIGLFGIGLETYWPQFDGLKAQLESYLGDVHNRLSTQKVNIINGGLIDNNATMENAVTDFSENNIDALVLYITTYALSSTVLPLVQQLNVPILILALQPEISVPCSVINQIEDRGVRTGKWLAHCRACSAPELANVFQRAGIPYHLVPGYLDDEEALQEIHDWLHGQCSKGFNIYEHRCSRSLL